MFVVAGVTGNTGSVVARRLVAAGHQVRGLTRQANAQVPDGVEPIVAALDDADALRRAFEGAEGAYLLCPPDLADPDPIGLYERTATAGATAARAAGLRRLVLLSSQGAQLSAGTGPVRGLYEAERILSDAALDVVMLRPAFFMDNWRGMVAPARDDGGLPTFLADLDAPMATVSTRDIGETAAALLTEESPLRVVELSGPATYSVNDVARTFGTALGRDVHAVQPPREAWEDVLVGNGVGPAYAALLAEMYDALNSGGMGFAGVPDQRHGEVTLARAVADWI